MNTKCPALDLMHRKAKLLSERQFLLMTKDDFSLYNSNPHSDKNTYKYLKNVLF